MTNSNPPHRFVGARKWAIAIGICGAAFVLAVRRGES